MSTTLPALRSVSIRESAVDALRNALLAGKFAPGEALSEPALASQMGISRGPVREALLVLEQEGLVNHNQNRGFSVLRLGPEDRAAMTKVRIPLETLALELAKPRASAADLEQLEAIVRQIVALYDPDFQASARADLRFHEKLWELAGNPWLTTALKRVAVPFFLYNIMYGGHSDRLDAATLDAQHQAYLDYLQGATGKSAEECVRLHLSLYETS
jgi:DNA-binding GntR family transcriptional regulator